MVITIVAGPGEGKSGLALWLSEQLKKRGAKQVRIHDDDTTVDMDAQVRENYEKIVDYVATTQTIDIITKQKLRGATDHMIISEFNKHTSH